MKTIRKQSLGVIGAGAFGAFMTRHLASHFHLVLHDAHKSVTALARKHRAAAGSLKQAAQCDVVAIAVPVQQMETVLKAIAPLVKPGALVVDVGSVKMKPAKLMQKILPRHVDLVGTHPLFGPQSGKNGIRGLNIVVCDVRGRRAACVRRFCKSTLGLSVFAATPEDHDRELAYVQGLTHLLAKVVVALDLPRFRFTTRTYEYLDQMVETVRYDSDELFRAIERENP
ncbi:MAG: prephenate dehydrogenase/arogenate dehydrogenase family protein, partial [Bdellovibrionales bacterium]